MVTDTPKGRRRTGWLAMAKGRRQVGSVVVAGLRSRVSNDWDCVMEEKGESLPTGGFENWTEGAARRDVVRLGEQRESNDADEGEM